MTTIQQVTGIKPREYLQVHGFKNGVKQLSDVTGVSSQTLINWYKSRPRLFMIVVKGAMFDLADGQ